jgi:murein DD-endopeptidase MepM/ murein hydrolase activator NlpD
MNPTGRHVTIVVHQDGELQSRSWRLPLWALRVGLVSLGMLAALILLGLAVYLPIAAQAARVPGLALQVQRLQAENEKIGELVAALDTAEARYDRIRAMLGSDIVPGPVQLATALPVAPPVRARPPGAPPRYEGGLSEPRHWPLGEPGFVTRGQAPGDGAGDSRDEAHPGIDVAVPVGTPVRASGGGVVDQAGDQGEYGIFVLLDHPDSVQTMYGHLSRLTVHSGDSVAAGQVIGLSGNTGRSSAPHLHFEIRRAGQPIDPRNLVQQEEN